MHYVLFYTLQDASLCKCMARLRYKTCVSVKTTCYIDIGIFLNNWTETYSLAPSLFKHNRTITLGDILFL